MRNCRWSILGTRGFVVGLAACAAWLIPCAQAAVYSTGSVACVTYATPSFQNCDIKLDVLGSSSAFASNSSNYATASATLYPTYTKLGVTASASDLSPDTSLYGVTSWARATYRDELTVQKSGSTGTVTVPHVLHITGSVTGVVPSGWLDLEYYMAVSYSGSNPQSTSFVHRYPNGATIDGWLKQDFDVLYNVPYTLSVGISATAMTPQGTGTGAATGTFSDSLILAAIVVPEGASTIAASGILYPSTDPTVPAVPEPTTLALFGLGLAGIGAVRRKKLAA